MYQKGPLTQRSIKVLNPPLSSISPVDIPGVSPILVDSTDTLREGYSDVRRAASWWSDAPVATASTRAATRVDEQEGAKHCNPYR